MSSTITKSEIIEELCARLRRSLVLTRGEQLFLSRRARGLPQADMARLCNVTLLQLRAWEHDLEDAPSVDERRVEDLQLHELCAVWRRRHGITLRQIAVVLDKSVAWVHGAERGHAGAREVVRYILAKGKT